MKFYVKNNCI